MIGVFLVPMGCVALLGVSGGEGGVSLATLLGNIALTLLLPLALGQMLRSRLKELFGRHKVAVRRFNNGVILFIVWTAFCQSFLRKVWSNVSGADLLMTAAGALIVLGLASLLIWFLAGRVGLDHSSRVTAFYCGSQKSLAVGLPVSALIFTPASGLELSLVLLPLLIYHPAQLILGGALAPVFEKRG